MRLIRCFTAALIVFSTAANATPFTYYFTMPWGFIYAGSSLYGTKLNLAITVDNSGVSEFNQQYQFSDIKSIWASAVGGSLNVVFPGSGPALYVGNSDGELPITTDASGIPTLNLGNVGGTYAAFINADPTGAYYITLEDWAASANTTLKIPIQVAWGQTYADVFPVCGPLFGCNLHVVGSDTITQWFNQTSQPGPSPVPGPPAWLMMLTGLGLLGIPLYYRRKARRALDLLGREAI